MVCGFAVRVWAFLARGDRCHRTGMTGGKLDGLFKFPRAIFKINKKRAGGKLPRDALPGVELILWVRLR